MDGLSKSGIADSSEQIVTVEIFGKPYGFKTDADTSTAQRIADFLVEEVNRVQMEFSHAETPVNEKVILIMTALNIANENFELKQNRLNLLKNLSDRSSRLIRTIDSVG